MSELYLPSRLVEELAQERELRRRQDDPIVFQDTLLRVGGLPGSTGAAFTNEELLREIKGWVAIGLRAITDRMSGLSLAAHQLVDDDENNPKLPMAHPANEIIRNPNPIFSMPVMLGLVGAWLKITGQAYLQVLHDGIGVPRELWPIPPDRIFPIPSTTDVITGYVAIGPNGQEFPLEPHEVVRIWRPDPARIYQAHGDLAAQADEYNSERFRVAHIKSTFEHDATPRSVLEMETGATVPTETEKTAWSHRWMEINHRRSGRTQGVPAILPPGFKIHEMGQNMEGAATAVLGDKARDQLLAALGTPGSLVGLVMDVNRAAAETNQYTFDRNTVMPMTDLFAGALTQQLAPQFDPRVVYEFMKFVSPDKEFEFKQEQSDLDRKVVVINEVRKRRNRDDAEWGSLPVGSFTDVPYTGEEDFGTESESDLGSAPRLAVVKPRSSRVHPVTDAMREFFNPDNSFQRVIKNERRFTSRFTRAMGTVFKAQADLVIERYRAAVPVPRARVSADDLFQSGELTKVYIAQVKGLREEIFVNNGNAVFEITDPASDFIFTEAQQFRLNQMNADMILRVDAHTKDIITRALSEGTSKGESVDQIARRMRSVISNRKRARTIARTEVGASAQLAQVESFAQSAVVEGKRWNASFSNTRQSHADADGQEVGLDEQFSVGAETTVAPLSPTLSAGERVNCQCFVTPRFVDDGGNQ